MAAWSQPRMSSSSAPWVAGRTDSQRALLRSSAASVFGFYTAQAMGCFRVWNASIPAWMFANCICGATQVPMLLAVTFTIEIVFVKLPSFFVLNSLLGLRGDFAQAVRSWWQHRQAWQLYWLRSPADARVVASSSKSGEALLSTARCLQSRVFRTMAGASVLSTLSQRTVDTAGCVGMAICVHARRDPNGVAAATIVVSR